MLINKLSKESIKQATQAFANVIKNHIAFESQFYVEGTIGLTIDKDNVVLLHFDEVFPKSCFVNYDKPIDDFEAPTLEIITLSPEHHEIEEIMPFLPTEIDSSSSYDYSKMMHCPLNTMENKRASRHETSITVDSDDDEDDVGYSEKYNRTVSNLTSNAMDMAKSVIRVSKSADCKNVKKLLRWKNSAKYKHRTLGRILTMQPCMSDHSGYTKINKTTSLSLDASKHEDTESENLEESKKEHISTGYICDVCNEKFQRLGRLESHLVTKHGIVENEKLGKITHFSCQFCKKIYRFQAELDKHIVSHKKREFQCLYCRNTYRHPETLSLHIQVHSGQLKCRPCNKVYQSKLHFQKHLVYMHEKFDVQ